MDADAIVRSIQTIAAAKDGRNKEKEKTIRPSDFIRRARNNNVVRIIFDHKY